MCVCPCIYHNGGTHLTSGDRLVPIRLMIYFKVKGWVRQNCHAGLWLIKRQMLVAGL